ncbi:MAG: hypothetical protein Q8K07_02350 [Methylicorpusculum sp.]|uniref:hypothetical protein n=1 Tax=Methylicorpusculum sp. TaxID=2713644 RepID=UPI00272FE40B|nr:hypothetical protein [Methylicorpusculum sp.]MDP2200833.1 hypothetical protein [Methylicorpusculum sp.]
MNLNPGNVPVVVKRLDYTESIRKAYVKNAKYKASPVFVAAKQIIVSVDGLQRGRYAMPVQFITVLSKNAAIAVSYPNTYLVMHHRALMNQLARSVGASILAPVRSVDATVF